MPESSLAEVGEMREMMWAHRLIAREAAGQGDRVGWRTAIRIVHYFHECIRELIERERSRRSIYGEVVRVPKQAEQAAAGG